MQVDSTDKPSENRSAASDENENGVSVEEIPAGLTLIYKILE